MERKITVVVKDRDDPHDERLYWASKIPKERVEAATRLRLQCFAMMGLEKNSALGAQGLGPGPP